MTGLLKILACVVGGVIVLALFAFRAVLLRPQPVLLSRSWARRLFGLCAGVLLLVPGKRGETADDHTAPRSPEGSEQDGANENQSSTTQTPFQEQDIQRWRSSRTIALERFDEVFGKRFLLMPEQLRELSEAGYDELMQTLAVHNKEPLLQLVRVDLAAIRTGTPAEPPSADQLVLALQNLRERGIYNHWWTGYVWRKTQALPPDTSTVELRKLFAAIEDQARRNDAMIQAEFAVKPSRFSARAWMSKAGPSREERLAEAQTVTQLLAAANRAYQAGPVTTWRRDALVRLRAAESSAPLTLWRGNEARELSPGETFTFGRLDLLETPAEGTAALHDLGFGPLALPGEASVTVWSLPTCLGETGQAHLQTLVEKALSGDEDAARELEIALPLTEAALRAGLARSPEAAGAARLRLILALFDDTLPALDEAELPAETGDAGR